MGFLDRANSQYVRFFHVSNCLCTTSSTSTKSSSRLGNKNIGESKQIREGFEKTKNSFDRQLHAYGFHRTKVKEGIYEYSNPCFLRNQPALLSQIKKQSSSSSSQDKGACPKCHLLFAVRCRSPRRSSQEPIAVFALSSIASRTPASTTPDASVAL